MSNVEMIPEAWGRLMERKGIARSYRALGEKAEVSHEAARRLITGRPVKRSTLEAVAGALGVDPEVLRELRGEDGAAALRPWYPPDTSALLTRDEREALSRIIGLMTKGRGEGSGEQPAANAEPGRVVMTPRPGRSRKAASPRRPGTPRGGSQG